MRLPCALLLGPSLALAILACGGGPSPAPESATSSATDANGSTAAPPSATSSDASGSAAAPASATPPPATGPATSAQGIPDAATSSGSPQSSAAGSPSAASAKSERCPAGMTFVAGGSFQRAGTSTAGRIPDLCVDTLETTARLYGDCVSAGKCTTSGLDCAAQSTYGKSDRAEHPLVCAEFSQAQAYCAFRGKRLPTTDEWEWFARGGSAARTYPWGEDAPDDQLCWAGKHKQTESCPVGTHPGDVSADGILDLGGNVLEFTTTAGDATSAVRIARGGSWNVGAPELFRTARLGGFGPDYRCGFLGIRCVTEEPASSSK
ncbi:MAG TPA: SUMF1/EgtB/PvdO family nonheme iron enzyme [Polyangiaceae bacterium]|nr:SUMF1/EgtB/PvdO family nonheme iron enzyme [Polyangiaceae bacterium]